MHSLAITDCDDIHCKICNDRLSPEYDGDNDTDGCGFGDNDN